MDASNVAPAYVAESHQADIVTSHSITMAFAFIFIAARFLARRISRAGFWWDDWLILFALFCATVHTVLDLVFTVKYGLGHHVFVHASDQVMNIIEKALLCQFVAELCYVFAIVSIKLSLCLMFWRIFRENIKIPVLVLLVASGCWGIALVSDLELHSTCTNQCFQFVCIMVQRIPINGFWDLSVQATHNIDSHQFMLGM